MASTVETILILAKTYPSPSAQYVETSCVAGITITGQMRRLYPVPFRMIEEGRQFKKWQWIEVRTQKANKDHRPESHRLFIDTIQPGNIIAADKAWSKRFPWIEKIPNFTTPEDIDTARVSQSVSLALLRPTRVLGLDITKAKNTEWTQKEKEKLISEQMQGNLFSEDQARAQIRELRKIPYDFYYRYACDKPAGSEEYRHKVVDWEAGALYWNCYQKHGENWESPFRQMLEQKLLSKNLMFLMGNQHRFQDQWLIISLIYPPLPPSHADTGQHALF